METVSITDLRCALMELDYGDGHFDVAIVGNKVIISSPDYTASRIWDMIDMSGVFGAHAVGSMYVDRDEQTVTLSLDLIRLQKVGNRTMNVTDETFKVVRRYRPEQLIIDYYWKVNGWKLVMHTNADNQYTTTHYNVEVELVRHQFTWLGRRFDTLKLKVDGMLVAGDVMDDEYVDGTVALKLVLGQG